MEIIRICGKSDALEMAKSGILEDFIKSGFPSTGKTSLMEIKELRQATDVPLKRAKEILSGEDVILEIGDDVRIQRCSGGYRLMRRIGGLWIAEAIGGVSDGWDTAESLFPEHRVKVLCSQNDIDRRGRRGCLRSYIAKLFISLDREDQDVWYRVGDHMVWHYGCLAATTDVYEGEGLLSKALTIDSRWCRSDDMEDIAKLAERRIARKAFGPF